MVPRFVDRQPAIQERLKQFAAVPRDQWFYELCYCLLTPQSKAAHADAVVQQLQDISFFGRGGEVVHLLRAPEHYIRFHNQKADRLHLARERWSAYRTLLESPLPTHDKRNQLASEVAGFGLKEASHFMRNIGYRGLGILDRHILTLLVRCHVFEANPSISTQRKYLEVEQEFHGFAERSGHDLDELDLFFWSEITSYILK